MLRAKYFLESWEAFLNACGYRKDRYFISREAADILRFIIDGFIALVVIHRDHVPGRVPLLPWLHSSEACEHVFGEARHVVKDFTYLDFIYMLPKLRVKLHEAVLRGRSSDPKNPNLIFPTYTVNFGDKHVNTSAFVGGFACPDVHVDFLNIGLVIFVFLGLLPVFIFGLIKVYAC
jgi:hypothetical protein